MFNFEKLEAWQLAIEFADDVSAATGAFSKGERCGLRSPLRRSTISISANLAEGSGRSSKREFSRFIKISFGSLMQTMSHLTIGQRQGLIAEETYARLYANAERLGRVLSDLRRSLGNRS